MARQSLRRTADRIDRVGRRVCIALVVLALPIALVVAWAFHHAAAADAERYRSTLHRAEATTLEPAPSISPVQHAPPPSVPAKWAGPNRAIHHGVVQVPQGTEAGYELMVWTSPTGELADPPPASAQLTVEAVLLAVGVAVGVPAAAIGSYLLLRRGTDRLRYREWDRAWEAFEAHHKG
jgi:hypothetical protein